MSSDPEVSLGNAIKNMHIIKTVRYLGGTPAVMTICLFTAA